MELLSIQIDAAINPGVGHYNDHYSYLLKYTRSDVICTKTESHAHAIGLIEEVNVVLAPQARTEGFKRTDLVNTCCCATLIY
jgi:hypothetical protein